MTNNVTIIMMLLAVFIISISVITYYISITYPQPKNLPMATVSPSGLKLIPMSSENQTYTVMQVRDEFPMTYFYFKSFETDKIKYVKSRLTLTSNDIVVIETKTYDRICDVGVIIDTHDGFSKIDLPKINIMNHSRSEFPKKITDNYELIIDTRECMTDVTNEIHHVFRNGKLVSSIVNSDVLWWKQ